MSAKVSIQAELYKRVRERILNKPQEWLCPFLQEGDTVWEPNMIHITKQEVRQPNQLQWELLHNQIPEHFVITSWARPGKQNTHIQHNHNAEGEFIRN